MSQKIEITKCVLKELGLEPSEDNLKKYFKIWWKSVRKKPQKSLWLTDNGFKAFNQADIKSYNIKFNTTIDYFDNKFVIWLDNNIDCPFYMTRDEIYLFGERTAIQLILFSGDLKMLYKAHTKNKEKSS